MHFIGPDNALLLYSRRKSLSNERASTKGQIMIKNSPFFLLLILSFSAQAAYEKPTLWSAKWSSLGGASVMAASGSDALVFNPAGLIDGDKAELGINFSPVIAKFKGPVVANNTQAEGENTFTPSAAILYSKPLNNKITIGAGVYGAGGNSAEYKNINFSTVHANYTQAGTNKTDLKLLEASIGMGFKLNQNWSFGAAWRLGMATADFFSSSASTTAAAHLKYKGLKDTNLTGFRFGAKYISDNKDWGIGLSYRSQVTYKLEGDGSGSMQFGTALTAANGGNSNATLSSGKVETTSRLPTQVSLGAFKKWTKLTTYFQFDWTDYSVNERIKFNGAALIPNAAAAVQNAVGDLTRTPVIQDGKDMYSLKLGLEYPCHETWLMRFGYALSTQVTPDNAARSTLASPGTGHLLAIGAGKSMSETWNLDFAIERAWRSGTVAANNPANSGGVNSLQGKYESAGYTAHMTTKFMF
jgi:long-subunit fatty acid transport protein